MPINANPVQVTHFNQQYRNKTTKKIYAEPITELPEQLRTLIDIVYNKSISTGSVLPEIVEKHLLVASEYSYNIAYSKAHAVFDTKVVIDVNNTRGEVHIYVNTDSGLELRVFKTVQRKVESRYTDTPLTKEEYFKNAGRTGKSKTIQYSDALDAGYKILFNIIYYVGIDSIDIPMEDLSGQLYTLLDNSEVTLGLAINQTAMVYGYITPDNVVTLNVREVGTPDTFYTRSCPLAMFYN